MCAFLLQAGHRELGILLNKARMNTLESSAVAAHMDIDDGAISELDCTDSLLIPLTSGSGGGNSPASGPRVPNANSIDDRIGSAPILSEHSPTSFRGSGGAESNPALEGFEFDRASSHDEKLNLMSKMSAAKGSSGGVNLLQVALSSLSLHDKCALSKGLESMGVFTGAASPDHPSSPASHGGLVPAARGPLLSEDHGFDSQNAWSESEQQSLKVAMSNMGPGERAKMEEEVKLIQNNVRMWLLRKNYTNLRDAARVLQSAWRERKQALAQDANRTAAPPISVRGRLPSIHSESSASDSSGIPLSTSADDFVPLPEGRKKRRTSERSPEPRAVIEDSGEPAVTNEGSKPSEAVGGREASRPSAFTSAHYSEARYSSAASRLQAATRQMLARRRQSFQNANRQAMASLVIQKSLLQWWNSNKQSFAPTNR